MDSYLTEATPVFRALADPSRRTILELLRAGPRPVGDIAASFPFSRPAVSKHLRILVGAGLVRRKRRGRERICELEPAPLVRAARWLELFRRAEEGAADAGEAETAAGAESAPDWQVW